MREVQGAICVASIVQFVIGYTGKTQEEEGLLPKEEISLGNVTLLPPGLLSLVLRFITPLTIGPSVAMIGLSLFDTAAFNASQNWGVSIGSVNFSCHDHDH